MAHIAPLLCAMNDVAPTRPRLPQRRYTRPIPQSRAHIRSHLRDKFEQLRARPRITGAIQQHQERITNRERAHATPTACPRSATAVQSGRGKHNANAPTMNLGAHGAQPQHDRARHEHHAPIQSAV